MSVKGVGIWGVCEGWGYGVSVKGVGIWGVYVCMCVRELGGRGYTHCQ